MSSITIATTEKNKPLLVFKGFNYTIDKTTDKKTYWKCEHCRTIKCKGRIHTDVNFTNILHENDLHNHPASAASAEVRLFQDKVRSRAVDTNESTQGVIDNCLRNVTDQMVARLPHFKYVKRNIQRQRQRNDLPQIPQDTNFTMIPTPLTTTIRHDKFLQFDSGPGDNRLVIFASAEQLRILEGTEEILIDGTFKVTPTIFTQLYTIHGVYRNSVFPLVFALLADKQQQTYHSYLINYLLLNLVYATNFLCD